MPTTGYAYDRLLTILLIVGFAIALILIGSLISHYARQARERARKQG
jgi:uncharacterized membrane protein YciS (DUF1049 family)